MPIKSIKISVFFLFISMFLLDASTFAQVKDLKVSQGKSKYVGVVLVIGNSDYKHATVLNSPVNDAVDMGKTLKQLGFKVLKVRKNGTLQEMENAVAEFGRELSVNGGIGVFYYSGHGVQSKGSNYLIPVEANIPNQFFLRDNSLNLNTVLATMEDSTKKSKIIILDACRNNPFEKSWRTKGKTIDGLAQVNAPRGTLIAYATSPDDVAADGNGRNSPYTEVLLKEIKKPGITIGDMFQTVRFKLNNLTNGNQIPWESTSLIGRYCFGGCNSINSNNNSIRQNMTKNELLKSYYLEAKKEYESKNYGKATELYNTILSIKPNSFQAYYFLSFLNIKGESKFSKAILNLNKAIELNPSFTNAYLWRGLIYTEFGNDEFSHPEKNVEREDEYNKRAINDFSKVIDLAKNANEKFIIENFKTFTLSGIYILRGEVSWSRADEPSNKENFRNYEEAFSDFSKAIALNPNNVEYYKLRGKRYWWNKQFQNAIKDYTKAINLSPNDPDLYRFRSKLYRDIGDTINQKKDQETRLKLLKKN